MRTWLLGLLGTGAILALLAWPVLGTDSPAPLKPVQGTFHPEIVLDTGQVVAEQWEEDSLPDEMYRWADERNADLEPVTGAPIEGTDGKRHAGCWSAALPTVALIMCPDGYRVELPV